MSARRIWAKLAALFQPSKAEREADREIAAHVSLLEEDFRRRGLSDPEARLAARRAVGGVNRTKDLHREARSFPWIEQMIQNLRYGTRTLARSPGFAAVAVLTLALGIGANAAIFSIVNAVLLHPLSYAKPGELIGISLEGFGPGINIVSYTKYSRLEQYARTLNNVGAFFLANIGLVSPSGPEQLNLGKVSRGFLKTLQVTPAMGRDFLPEEDREGGRDVALISDAFWHNHLGGDPGAVGRILTLDGKPTTVVGILPADFRFPFLTPEPDVWLPRVFENPNYPAERIRAGASYLFVFGRIKQGQTLRSVQSELDSINNAYEHEFKGMADSSRTLHATPLETVLVGNLRPSLLALLAAACFVLLIACVNVASLLLARATSREREIAIRQAVGAAGGHLFFQVLTESGLLCFFGGGLGILVAWWSVPLLMRILAPGTIPRADQIHVDSAVLGVSLFLCVLTSAVFGLAPFLHSWRKDLHEKLKAGVRGSTTGGSAARVRQVMVVSEVALALVLMAGAGLLIKSLVNLSHVNPGFESANVLTFPFGLPGTAYPTPGQRSEFFRQFVEKVRNLPGVQASGMVSHLPLSGGPRFVYFCADGTVCQGLGKDPILAWRQVSPGFFGTLRIPLLRGRDFSERDTADSPKVAIVDEMLAKKYFPNMNPVGRHLANSRDKIPLEIIGVVKDLKFTALNVQSAEEMYVPFTQGTWPSMTLVIRSSSSAKPLIDAVRRSALALDPVVPLSEVASMDSIVSVSIAQPRLIAGVVGTFAIFALLLASVGIYGVMAYLVTQRSQEVAIRIALGAHRQNILQMVLGQGTRLVSIGVALGLLVSLGVTRLLRTLLFATGATDAATLVGVSVIFLIVALAACYIPARRAMRLDPTVVLRGQ